MKNVLTILLCLVLVLSVLAGCGNETNAPETAASLEQTESFGADVSETQTAEIVEPQEDSVPDAAPGEAPALEDTAPAEAAAGADEPESGSGVLVLYFSAADNDGIDAIASATLTQYEGGEYGAAQLLATWIADYTGGDLSAIVTAESYPEDYDSMADMAKEQADNNEHPALSSYVENFDQYRTVFLVYPVWWYQMPMAMYSVFDEYDFTGKNVFIATTHAGSRLAGGQEDAAGYEPGANIEESAFTVAASSAAEAKADVENWLEETSGEWR